MKILHLIGKHYISYGLWWGSSQLYKGNSINILIQSCIFMVSIQQKVGRKKISSKLQCNYNYNLRKELSSSVMVQTKRRLLNEQRHSYHRVYICNCLQNSGFQLKSILCKQCVLLWQLLSVNFKFQLQFLFQNSINLRMPKDAFWALNIPLMGGGNFSSS